MPLPVEGACVRKDGDLRDLRFRYDKGDVPDIQFVVIFFAAVAIDRVDLHVIGAVCPRVADRADKPRGRLGTQQRKPDLDLFGNAVHDHALRRGGDRPIAARIGGRIAAAGDGNAVYRPDGGRDDFCCDGESISDRARIIAPARDDDIAAERAHAFAAGIGHDMVDPLLQEDIAVLHGHFRLDLAARIFVRIGNAADHSQRDRFGLDGESPAGAGEIFRPVEIAARRNVYREGISPRVRGGAVQLFAVSIIIGDGDLAAANALFGNDFYLLLFSVICNLFGRNNKVVGGQGAALGDRHRDGIVGDGVIFRGDAPFSTDKMRIIYARRYGITARLLQRSRIGDDRLAAVDGDINRDGRLGIRRL